ncbi:MAG: ATP/GTP-binding protein [Desulfurococcus sp.]|nr:ATP/GTP-binding protein [Desulfurococcus sp.]
MVVVAVFVGPAGSGKTSLVKSYSEWARRNLLLKTAIVNLDPGAEELGYTPTLDIREFFTLRDVMAKYGLGPNGAFVKSSELLLDYIDLMLAKPPFSNMHKWDLVLVDTPGQMEAFIFRPAGNIFLRHIARRGNTVLAYLIDASTVESVADAVTLWFIYVLLQVKTGLTTVPVVSKTDAARRPEILRLIVENPSDLVKLASSEHSFAVEIIPDLLNVAMKTKGPYRAVEVSVVENRGFYELHSLIHEAFCACGDLT